ncbi:transposase [Mangrovicoccus sp. HB161399]
MPDHSTLCRRQARIALQIPHRASRQPLNLLIPARATECMGLRLPRD